MRRLPLSLLAEKLRQQGDTAVTGACWLVREPSPWQPPEPGANVTQPLQPELSLKPAGESLAFELDLEAQSLKLGRADTCEISLNDGTLSKVHLLLERANDGTWWVNDHGSSNGTFLDSVKLPAHAPAALHDGSKLLAGNVALTFHDAAGMITRLRALIAVQNPRSALG